MKCTCLCGLRYEKFRTGLTYREVCSMLWSGSDDPKTWRYRRRHTVLGLWHQLKKGMWSQHVEECQYYHNALRARRKERHDAGVVPF